MTKRDIGAEIIEGLKEFRDSPKTLKRKTVDELNVRLVRESLGMSQAQFADFLDISKRTLEKWEQGTRNPAGAARTLLRVIQHDPKLVMRALHA
ncbi:MAG: helix-turn-helix domain-containing protein [Woeseia sp.]